MAPAAGGAKGSVLAAPEPEAAELAVQAPDLEAGDIPAAVRALVQRWVEEAAREPADPARELEPVAGHRLATAEPQNGFLPHRCYTARARVEDRGLAELAVPAANTPLQKMTSARC